MPLTLYRYILKELVKLLVLTSTILVLVISFAAATRPLSEGLLGPDALLRFVFLTAPTMLNFALPFAGAFASTLVFLRLAADNEIQACSASGISYRSILMPVVSLGVVLMMGLFLLSNFVIPFFYRAAERTVESDLVTVLVSRLHDDQPVTVGDMVVYADSAGFGELSEEDLVYYNFPYQWIQLRGLALAEVNPQGEPTKITTAREANALVYQMEDQTVVKMALAQPMLFEPGGDSGITSQVDPAPIRLPSFLRDKPKFLSWPQMSRLEAHPERFDTVRHVRDQLLRQIAMTRLREVLFTSLSQDQPATLTGAQGERYTLRAPQVRVEGQDLVLTGEQAMPVVVSLASPAGTGRRYEPQRVVLSLQSSGEVGQPAVRLQMEEVTVFDASVGGRSTEQRRLLPLNLYWPEEMLAETPEQTSVWEAGAMAQLHPSDPAVQEARGRMLREVEQLARRIIGQLHERAAAAVSCLLLLILGALLAMLNRGRMPLVVYFWSFLLAILTVIITNSGERMAGELSQPLAGGLAMLWSSNVLLAAFCGALYCRLARH